RRSEGPSRRNVGLPLPALLWDTRLFLIASQAERTERTRLMPTNTIRIHRVLRAASEKIYRAFLDPDAMSKWLPPNGFTGKVHEMEAKVGGSYRMSFTNFTTGQTHSFGGTYLELVP